MNPPDPQADAVWQSILPQIRATRRKRSNSRLAGVAAACCALAIWFALRSPEAPEKQTVQIKTAPQIIETMAVMRVDENGTIRLEEIASNNLGTIDFDFGQTPILHSEWPYQ